jgi:hypothetical protein
MGLTDIHHGLIGAASRAPAGTSALSQLQFRAQADDVYLAPFMARPLMGVEASAAYLDGIARGALTKRWDASPFVFANGPKIHLAATVSGTYPAESLLLPEQWSDAHVTELAGRARVAAPANPDSSTLVLTLDAGLGFAAARSAAANTRGYGRALASLESFSYLTPGSRALTIRVNGGTAPRAPIQRMIFASSADPFETFTNDYWRPRGAAFKQENLTLTPLGGARLRGFDPAIALRNAASANVDLDQRLASSSGGFGSLGWWGGVFGDAGFGNGPPLTSNVFVDLGVSLRVRGRLYDRDVDLRVSVPLAVNDPLVAGSSLGASRFRMAIDWR